MVTEGGATLRLLEHLGRPLVDGFALDAVPTGGRGQLLMPWPNRIARRRPTTSAGRSHQLPLSEPARHHASHGLVRWASWTPEEQTGSSVSLVHRLMAQTGYPWTLDLHVLYDAGSRRADGDPDGDQPGRHGRAVRRRGASLPGRRRRPGRPARADPARPPPGCSPTSASFPRGSSAVDGTDYDFRATRPVRQTVLDHAFTDLARDAVRTCHVGAARPGHRTRASRCGWTSGTRWLQVYTADDAGATARRSLAVEPMTAPPDAFRSGTDLVTLAPAGEPGDEFSVTWGIRAVG